MHVRLFYIERIGYALHARFFYTERIGYALHITLFCSGRIKYALHISHFCSDRIKYALHIAFFYSSRIKYALHNLIFHIGRIINAVNFGFSIAFGMLTAPPFGSCLFSVCLQWRFSGAATFRYAKSAAFWVLNRFLNAKSDAFRKLPPFGMPKALPFGVCRPCGKRKAPRPIPFIPNRYPQSVIRNSSSSQHPRRGAHQICLAPQQTNNSTPQQLNTSTLPAPPS